MTKAEKSEFLNKIKGKLIVSCQALEDEPLYDTIVVAKMAQAVKEGGSVAIRANYPQQIEAIQKATGLPVIALYKKEYQDSQIIITPTMEEIDALAALEPEVIAMDATSRIRPGGLTLEVFFKQVKDKYPHQMFMADTSCYEEGVMAQKLGFDLIGTTLSGYTSYTQNRPSPDYELMQRFCENLKLPIIAEGGIWTPLELKKTFETGVWAAIIGTAITRPREITRRFIDMAGLE
ncbi:MAG: N-acetylmannosamine-6-phosphate 2-epimerase [Clostridiales bacterium]|nr:N-acetylmannosamine-6-phosphate 2-epimerase [Clostridiales bacterium]